MASEACGWVGESDMINGSDQSCFSFFNFMHQHLPEIGYADRIWCHSLWSMPVGVCWQLNLSGAGKIWLSGKIPVSKPEVIQQLTGTSQYYVTLWLKLWYCDCQFIQNVFQLKYTVYLNKNKVDDAVKSSTKNQIYHHLLILV